MFRAQDCLNRAVNHIEERGRKYNRKEGERSMSATVAAFNAITGHTLSEEQGWLFMEVLKAVRAEQGTFDVDHYEDGAAYAALKGEAAARVRGIEMPEMGEEPSFKTVEFTCPECGSEDVRCINHGNHGLCLAHGCHYQGLWEKFINNKD